MLSKCLKCKELYLKTVHNKKYCSIECYTLALNARLRGKKKNSNTLRICPQCKKESIFRLIYCNTKCEAKAARERKKNSPKSLTPTAIILRDQILQEVDPKKRLKLIKKITKEIRKPNA